jgi:2-keto-4-pentenoate hydratase/2-oxohepta-3-ene-1,7-dioic acid hydratase in catechol pathway
MKLVTFEVATSVGRFQRVGALTDAGIIDLVAAYGAYLASKDEPRAAELATATLGATMIDFFRGGQTAREAADRGLDHVGSASGPVEGPRGEQVVYDAATTRLLAPVPRPNTLRDFTGFRSHMQEYLKSADMPPELTSRIFESRPMYYKGNPSMVIGPEDVVPWSSLSKMIDFEVEPAVIIGRYGVNISPEDAHEYIGGYTIFNDISLRDFQKDEIALPVNLYGVSKSKDAGSYPLGPCIVTPDELHFDALDLIVRVNGEEWVHENTRDMTWSFSDLIAFASIDEPVHPGDLLAGGAPPRGSGAEIGRWLSPGDVIELEIPGIGVLRNAMGHPTGKPNYWQESLSSAQ